MRSCACFLKGTLALAFAIVAAVTAAEGQTAVFSGFDTTHQGSWVGNYGADGYIIANGTDAHPGYATLSFNGASTWTWLSPSPDPRALYSAASTASSRISSTYYSTTNFSVDLNIAGSSQVALYCVDLDTTSRSQTISILNASNNTVLDTQAVTGFNGGVWAVWNVSGHVIIRVTNNPGSIDAVVSGLFFRNLVPVAKPTVTLNTPAQNPITGPIALSATATSPAAIASVQFQVDGANIGSPVTASSGSTYSVQWTNPTNGAHSLTAIATDSQSQTTTSAPVSVNVSVPTPIGPTAAFVKFDATTLGKWPTVYGGDGYIIANGNAVIPSYATETTSGAQAYTWYNPSTDLRALLTSPTGSTRIASTFYTPSTFSFDVNIADGQTHQVALYGLDYETNQRSQVVTILDPATQTTLSTQTMASMNGGVYAVWNISGHVVINVTYTGGFNAVISGVFFGGPASTTAPPPTVSIASPVAGPVSGAVNVTANASSSIGVASVQYFLDGSALGTSTAGPAFAYSWNTTTASNASHSLTAIATDTMGQASPASAGVTVTVANVATPPPSISITKPTGGTVSNTITLQATATAASPASMQSVQFKIDNTVLATVTGAGPYSASWNTAAASNASHVITTVATDSLGHSSSTTITVTVSNAPSNNTATLLKTDFSTSGNWVHNYGADGYVIANGNTALPSYAQIIVSPSALTYTWNNPSADGRALYSSPGATSRIASTYYSSASLSFDVNLTDAQTHQIALYALDIDSTSRTETITINDASTNAVLSTLPLSNFNTGVWAVWNVSGHVVITVTYTGGLNAVVSGLFFGGNGIVSAPPPTVTLNSPSAGAVTGSVSITSTPASSIGIASVQYYLDGNALGSPVASGPSYSFVWDTTTATNASHTLTAIATDTQNQKSAASAGVLVTVSNPVVILPTVTISNPTGGTVSGTVNIQANASASSPATLTSVRFSIDGNILTTLSGTGPFSTNWDTTTASNGNHTITASATDSNSHTKSTSVTVNALNIVVSANTAEFVKSDTTTQGSWVGVYGADGFIISNDITSPPAYVTVGISGGSGTGLYTWFPSTTDVRAPLANSSGSNRIASTFYTQSTETFDLAFNDGQIHQVAVYCLDYDTTSRTQTLQVIDAATSNVLDTQLVSNFNGGVYEIWNLTGHVQIQVTNTNPLTSAVSGLFFRSLSGVAAPSVTFASPASGATVSGPIALSVNASSAQGVSSVQFQVDGVNAGAAVSGAGPTFTSHWASPLVANGVHTLSAIVEDNLGLKTTSSENVTVSNGAAPKPAAVLTSFDVYTGGNWKGVYGQDGQIIASDVTNPPFYAVVNLIGTDIWIWHGGNPTTDYPALFRANSTLRIGAAFENPVPTASYSIDVNFVDYLQHELSLYMCDWHHNVRVQTITVTDANTNAILDFERVTNFSLGAWYTWNITGHVIITLTLDQADSLASPSSVVSAGIFFQSAAAAPRPTVSITTPTPSQAVSKTVTLSAAASSSIGVSSVQFILDGIPVGGPVTGGTSYNLQWDSTTSTNGTHALNAIATDSSGHSISSAPVSINVSN